MLADRRIVLKIAGAAVVAAIARPAAARSTDMDGTITFEGGIAIPAGQLRIYLEDPAVGDEALGSVVETRIESDGASRTIAFALSTPEALLATTTLRIVARLERADGWLLARGSAQPEAGSPVEITLSTVMY